MNILVLTEGGRETGFGHLSRCVSLTQGMARFNKAEVSFVVNGDGIARGFLKRQGIRSITISNWIKEKNKIKDLVKKPDIVIIDSYLAPKLLYEFIHKAIRGSNGRLLCVDDCNRIDYPLSVVLNPCIYGDRLEYDMNPESLYLLGKDYTLLRKEFWRVPRKHIRRKVKDVLITFGGGVHRDCTERLTGFLSERYPEFRHHFISPELNLSVKHIIKLMLKCDICISSGGQTVYELARIGLPTIGICVAGNQRLNLETWQNKGFVNYIGWEKDKGLLDKLGYAIEKFLPYRERSRCSKTGRNLMGKRCKDWISVLKLARRAA